MRINQGLLLPPSPLLPLLLPLLLLLLPPLPPSCSCCSTRHGYNSSLSADVVFTIESTLGNVTSILEQLAMDMFSVSVYGRGQRGVPAGVHLKLLVLCYCRVLGFCQDGCRVVNTTLDRHGQKRP